MKQNPGRMKNEQQDFLEIPGLGFFKPTFFHLAREIRSEVFMEFDVQMKAFFRKNTRNGIA